MSGISFIVLLLVLVFRIFDIPIFGMRASDVQGFSSTILTILLIGGIQLISTGVLGEYIGRIYTEAKGRPTYVIRDRIVHPDNRPGFANGTDRDASLTTNGSGDRRYRMITTWSHGAPEDNMDENILIQLSDIVSRHPWWAARAEIVLALLSELRIPPPANILEVGCGWGTELANPRRRWVPGYRPRHIPESA